MKLKLKHIPNILSIIRILLVGVFICLFFLDYPRNLPYALLVFVLAGVTDVVDGFLARKFNWISNLGKVLDPLADKLMQCTVLICMLIKSLIPAWLVIPFILKEVLMLLGGLFIFRKRSVLVVSNVYGKATVVVFYIAIIFCILKRDCLAENPMVLYAICGAVLVLAVSALVNYAIEYLRAAKRRKIAHEIGAVDVNTENIQ